MICISIAQESRRFALVDMHNAARQCDLIELRLDRFEKCADVKELLDHKPKPVIMSARRPKDGGQWEGSEEERLTLRHPSDHTKYRTLSRSAIARFEPLQVEVLRQGKLVYELPSLEAIRQRRVADVEALDPGIRRLVNPHIYHVSLGQRLWDLKQGLIEAAMRQNV